MWNIFRPPSFSGAPVLTVPPLLALFENQEAPKALVTPPIRAFAEHRPQVRLAPKV